MTSLLASPRGRRRIAWLGGAALVVALATFFGVRYANTGHRVPSVYSSGPVARVAPNPKADPFTPEERREVRAVATRFISTAVFRKNVGDSWALTAPELRQGMSHAAWNSGAIPVVPYPEDAIAEVRWRLNYSYANAVGMKVAFFPKPGAEVMRQVFDIELKKVGAAGKDKWLVSFWSPSGGAQIAAADPRGPPVSIGTSSGSIRPIWLLAPVGLILGSMLLLLGWLAARGWIREARANRAHSKSL